MPNNPYVRAIKLFNPSVDLAVDDADPRRRVRNRRPPVNPAEGLLGEEDDSPSAEAASEPAPRRAAAPVAAAASAARPPAVPADDGMSVSADGDFDSGPDATGAGTAEDSGDEPAERFQGATLGEVPDAIDADLAAEFPEPVDL